MLYLKRLIIFKLIKEVITMERSANTKQGLPTIGLTRKFSLFLIAGLVFLGTSCTQENENSQVTTAFEPSATTSNNASISQTDPQSQRCRTESYHSHG